MSKLDYSIVACAIKKYEFVKNEHQDISLLDPYMLCLNNLIERFCTYLSNTNEIGSIVAERRFHRLDDSLNLHWDNIRTQGLPTVKTKQINQRIIGLELRAKNENIAGLQLADLVVSPIDRHLIGKSGKND